MIRTANLTWSVSRKAGGLFESVRRLVKGLADTGMDVHVFGIKDQFTDADLPIWSPVPVSAFKPTGPERFGYSPRFVQGLNAYRPDVTHTHGIWLFPSIATNVHSRRARVPYVISPHGMLDPWAVANSRWKKAIAHFLYEGAHLREARCLRALCESEARAMRQLRLKNDICIIPNGIDLPTAPPSDPPPWHGIVEPGRKVLLFLSRIHPKKGLPNLIRAWASIQNGAAAPVNGVEDWVLAIAGWDQGGHEAQLKELASILGLVWTEMTNKPGNGAAKTAAQRSNLVFLGPQFGAAKAACYHHCHSFVLPSLSEGVPMVVLEAWAYSKPVVMTSFCNIPEGFDRGAAIDIETTPESIARGLNELLSMTRSERTEMGKRGYSLAAERFTWTQVTLQLKEVYDWILGGGAKPACIADF